MPRIHITGAPGWIMAPKRMAKLVDAVTQNTLRKQGMKKTFYIFRHGETDWNLERRNQGWSDISLNQTGLAQAQALAESLRGVNFDIIYSSPLRRAAKTAQIVAANNNCEIAFVDGLRERCGGVFDGKIVKMLDLPTDTKIDFDAVPVQVPIDLMKNPDFVPPNGESHNMLARRVHETLMDIAKNTTANTIGIATHAGVARSIAQQFANAESVRIPNAGYYKLEWDGQRFILRDTPEWMQIIAYNNMHGKD